MCPNVKPWEPHFLVISVLAILCHPTPVAVSTFVLVGTTHVFCWSKPHACSLNHQAMGMTIHPKFRAEQLTSLAQRLNHIKVGE